MRQLLLDRDGELRTLARHVAQVRTGAGRVIVVEGPAGIGKSSLLAAAGRSAAADGVAVLRARGGPLDQDAAWGIARHLFEPLRDTPAWSELAVGAAALSQRALDADPVEPASGGDAMHAAARGLVWLASNLAARTPALLIVDDVHWADMPSLRWLAQLTRSLDGLALGVLCAVRSGEPPGDPDLLAELLAAAPEPPVRPRSLGPAAAEALVRERFPAADAAFARACHAVTAGNPFLLHALLDQLVAERVEPTDEVARRLTAFGSEPLARSIERRLARLPDGAGTLARAVAVLGRGTPLRHAARLSRLEHGDALRLADALRAAGLFDDDDELALAHPLVEAALYSSLPRGERALWHADAAELLARERADPDRIALHLLRTDPAADPVTVARLREAAAGASARGAPQNATVLLRRAIAEPALDPATDAELRLELGLALAAYLDPDAPRALQDAVDAAASPGQRSAIALRGARALGLAGHFRDAFTLCRRALAAPGDAPPVTLDRLEAELVTNAWLHVDMHADAHRHLRHPTVAPPPLQLWRINAAMASTLAGRPACDTLGLLAPMLEPEALAGDPDSLAGTVMTLILIANDELDAARRRADRIIDTARPRGWLIALAHGSMLRAMAGLRAGRVADAEAAARLTFDYKLPVTPQPAMLWSLACLVDALVELDELDAADAALIAARVGTPPGGWLPAPLVLQGRARLRLAQQRAADAHEDLLDAAARWRELDVHHPGLATWRNEAAEALARLGDDATARRLAQEQLALAERVGLPGARGAALRALARTAPVTERLALLRQAVDVLADSPARLEHTRALVDLGAALRRANHRTDARHPLRRALEQAERGGMLLLARRARHELRASGARPRRSALTGPDALTAAEQRVASLAADGHSNREIAEQLYVTQRTVETHLTHVFRKLRITSRTQLSVRITSVDPADPTHPAIAPGHARPEVAARVAT